MSDLANSIGEFVKWLRDSNRPAWVLCIVTSAALLIPSSWISAMGMTAWMTNYKPWLLVVWALSLVWLITHPFVVMHAHHRLKERIRHSASDEKYVLAEFIRADEAIRCFGWNHSPSTHSLIRDKILFDTATRDGGNGVYVGIDPWVFKYLKEHKDVLGIE